MSEIDEFKKILDENHIPWIMNKNDVVFCMCGYVFIITTYDLYNGAKFLSLKSNPDYSSLESQAFFDPKRILPYIEDEYGGL